MIRLTLFYLLLTFISLRSFKDWYTSLCVLIVLTALIEHPDVPKSIGGIQGVNPWNILLVFVMLGWLFNKKKEELSWDLPPNINFLLVIYLLLCIVAYFRVANDIAPLIEWNMMFNDSPPSALSLFSEHVINVLKWVIPGVLLYHGCNSTYRFKQGIWAIIAFGLIIALLTIKTMPAGAITSGDQLQYLAIKLLQNNVGFHRVNIAMLMAAFFWAAFSFKDLFDKSRAKYFYLICLILFYALALTGGRTGYITWGLIGLGFAVVKWRKILFLIPVALLAIVILLPAAQERLLMGFSDKSVDAASDALVEDGLVQKAGSVDLYTVTSGRTSAWPFVLKEIGNAPFIGYGKEAMIRIGISTYLYETYNEVFPHPHNMYLQWLLDNGALGFIPVILFYLLVIKYSTILFFDRRSRLFEISGAVTLSFIGALFIAGIGSQTFYPREGSVPMWCTIFLMLRIFQERSKIPTNTKNDIDSLLFRKTEPPKPVRNHYNF